MSGAGQQPSHNLLWMFSFHAAAMAPERPWTAIRPLTWLTRYSVREPWCASSEGEWAIGLSKHVDATLGTNEDGEDSPGPANSLSSGFSSV